MDRPWLLVRWLALFLSLPLLLLQIQELLVQRQQQGPALGGGGGRALREASQGSCSPKDLRQ